MAGGNWDFGSMPVLPGLYLNFEAAGLAAIKTGARGTLVTPVKAHWGPVQQFAEITNENAIAEIYSNNETGGATARATLRFALLGGAKKILGYRLAGNDAAKATITLQDTTTTTSVPVLKLDAKYPGERANNFKITVQSNVADNTKKDIKIYESARLLATFTFVSGTVQAAADAIAGNKWVDATVLAPGNGVLADVTSMPLANGNSGISTVTAADYMAALSVFETTTFDVLTLDGITDDAIHASVASWVRSMRAQGTGVIATLGGSLADDGATNAVQLATSRSAGFNHEGLVNVGTGVVLDGTQYSSAQTSAYVAGLIAGQRLSESTTYAPTPFDDVIRRWTRSEQETAVSNGVFLPIHDGRIVKSLQGMNSLITLRQKQKHSWKKIRAIRIMDAINTDMMRTAEDNYIGKVNNTHEGRVALIGACGEYMRVIARAGVIETEGWEVYLDPVFYGPGARMTPKPDQVFIEWKARLTDVMEFIFGRFIVQ